MNQWTPGNMILYEEEDNPYDGVILYPYGFDLVCAAHSASIANVAIMVAITEGDL